MPNFERRLGMSSGSLKSSIINTIRKRDEKVFKKTIKGYKKAFFPDQQKTNVLFLNLILLDTLLLQTSINVFRAREKNELHSC